MFSLFLLSFQFTQATERELGILSPVFWAELAANRATEAVRQEVQAGRKQRKQQAFDNLGFSAHDWERLIQCGIEFNHQIEELKNPDLFQKMKCAELRSTPEGRAMWQKYQEYEQRYGHRRLSAFTSQEIFRLATCTSEFAKPAEVREMMGMDTYRENKCDELKTTSEGRAMLAKYQRWYNETYLANRVAQRQLDYFDILNQEEQQKAYEAFRSGLTHQDLARLVTCDIQFSRPVEIREVMGWDRNCDELKTTPEGKAMYQKYLEYEQKWGRSLQAENHSEKEAYGDIHI